LRLRIVFSLKNKGASLPFHHQHLLAQLIKGIIYKGGNEEFKAFTHYNFSALKGQTKVSREGLHYNSNRVTLVFSSPNEEFNSYFLASLFEMPKINIGNLLIVPQFVEKEIVPNFRDKAKFICISPVVLLPATLDSEESKQFISPEDDRFSDLLYDSLIQRMEALGKFTEEELKSFYKFQLVPDKDYLQRIRDQKKKFARIYSIYEQDVKYEIRGYTLPFTLYADPVVQEFVFTSGIGLLTHKGFGMIDFATTNPALKTETYEVVKSAGEGVTEVETETE